MDLGPKGRGGRLTWVYCALISALLDDAWVVVHKFQSIAGVGEATGAS